MDKFAEKIVEAVQALYRFYYRKKFKAILKHIGSEEMPPDTRRGLIIIQIDALAYDYLLKALKRGYMPFLRHLLEKGMYRISSWYCGLPSTTPAVQAGLLFGSSFDIPGFRWYEKDRRLKVECRYLHPIQAVQERLSRKWPGLLRGGSCYCSMFDGGATLSLFTMGAINRRHFFQSIKGVSFIVLFLLNPLRVLKVICLSLWEYIRESVRQSLGLLIPYLRLEFNPARSLAQVLVNIIFRELQTFACMVDIYRGVPAIYTNYYSYDEIAHHNGPLGSEALRALKGIDKQIRQIIRMCSKYQHREYDVYIISDHGLSPSIPFEEAFGYSLGQFIAEQAGEGLSADERREEEGVLTIEARLLVEELERLEGRLVERKKGLAPFPAYLIRAFRRYLYERLALEEKQGWDLSKKDDIVVCNSGSLSHVYFNVATRKLNLSEIIVLYPGLIEKLVEHPGIGLVVAREGEETLLLSRQGALVLGPEGKRRGGNPLALLEDADIAVEAIRRLASFPHSGDLILFGAWDKKGRVITFENQVATHGGLGGLQTRPFILYPACVPLTITPHTRAEHLYQFLMEYYRLPKGVGLQRAKDYQELLTLASEPLQSAPHRYKYENPWHGHSQ